MKSLSTDHIKRGTALASKRADYAGIYSEVLNYFSWESRSIVAGAFGLAYLEKNKQ